jgi:hypothetical protein
MQQSDLFKAEYVFIVDSEGEDETTNRKGEQGPPGGTGNMAVRPKSLAISSSLVSDVVRPKVREADLKASSHPEILHGVAPQQKHGQVGFVFLPYEQKLNVCITLGPEHLERSSCLRYIKKPQRKMS